MTPSSQLNKDFFNGIYKDVWKEIIPPGLTEAECDFLIDICSLERGSKVIDLMCGYGRHSFALAEKGVEILAVDSLKEYIEEINEKKSGSSMKITAVQDDVLNMQLVEKYDAAICMGNSFAFFNRTEAVTLLKNISDHLQTGGKLVINSWMIAEIAIRHFKEREWYEMGEKKYLLHYNFCFNPNRIESEQTIVGSDNSIEALNGIDYIYSLDDLNCMFEETGFQMEATYSSPRKKPFRMGDNKAYIIAHKI